MSGVLPKHILYVEDHAKYRDSFVAACTVPKARANHVVEAPAGEPDRTWNCFFEQLRSVLGRDNRVWDALVLDIVLASEKDAGMRLYEELKKAFPGRWKHVVIFSTYAPYDMQKLHPADSAEIVEFVQREAIPWENVFARYTTKPATVIARIEELL